MTLREAIEQYILWRQAHGAKFTSGAAFCAASSNMPMAMLAATRSPRCRFWPFLRARVH